jgi:hypothetical protein
MSADTLRTIGNYAIAIVSLILLAWWLRADVRLVGVLALFGVFFPGVPLLGLGGLLLWRLISRQPLRGPSPQQSEAERKQRDDDLDHRAGV